MRAEDFTTWVELMDTEIAQLSAVLPKDTYVSLDFSESSLISLEEWMLDTFPNVDKILRQNNKYVADRLSRYVGETLRRPVNGAWSINLTDERYAFFKTPIIEFDNGEVECPLRLVVSAVDRRKGDYMYTVVKNKLRRLTKRD